MNVKILVVADDPRRDEIKSALERRGYEVVAKTKGEILPFGIFGNGEFDDIEAAVVEDDKAETAGEVVLEIRSKIWIGFVLLVRRTNPPKSADAIADWVANIFACPKILVEVEFIPGG